MATLRPLSRVMEQYRRKALRAFFFAALFFCFPAAARAGDIFVTGVTRDTSGSITLEFNNVLSVGGITVKETGEPRLKFPCYVSRRGVSYPFVRLLTRQAKEAAEKAATRGAAPGKGTLSYTINDIRPYHGKSSSLKGFAVTTFNNSIAVDCKILMSGGRLWVAWPAIKEGETWRRLVSLNDRRLRAAIEKDICAQFTSVRNN